MTTNKVVVGVSYRGGHCLWDKSDKHQQQEQYCTLANKIDMPPFCICGIGNAVVVHDDKMIDIRGMDRRNTPAGCKMNLATQLKGQWPNPLH